MLDFCNCFCIAFIGECFIAYFLRNVSFVLIHFTMFHYLQSVTVRFSILFHSILIIIIIIITFFVVSGAI